MSKRALKDRHVWKKVRAPIAWQPTDIDTEICGFYGGRTVRIGQYGEYTQVIVHVPGQRSVKISGIAEGHAVRVVFKGLHATTAGHNMKRFELYIADVPAEARDGIAEGPDLDN